MRGVAGIRGGDPRRVPDAFFRATFQTMGHVAKADGRVSEEEIRAFDAHGHKRRMGTILVEAGVLTQEQLDAALAEQAANPQRRVGTIVVERGFTSEEVIARILAAQLRLRRVPLPIG